MARRREDEEGELPSEEPFPDPDRPGRPPPDTGETRQRLRDISEARFRWAEALDYRQIANEESAAKALRATPTLPMRKARKLSFAISRSSTGTRLLTQPD